MSMPDRRRSSARSVRPARGRVNVDVAEIVDRPPTTWFVASGSATDAPNGTTPRDALRFADADPDHMAISVYPVRTPARIEELAAAWELHPLLLEDLLHAHQRPKLDRYGDVLFVVVRSARYVDDPEQVQFAEFHVLVRPNAVAVICQDGLWVDGTDGTGLTAYERPGTLISDERFLRLGPEGVVYRLLDTIVDDYLPVLQGLAIDKEQIEHQVFSGDVAAAERIYRLSREIVDLQNTTVPLADVISALTAGFQKYAITDELRAYLHDVEDHLTRVNIRVTGLREALSQILDVNATLVDQRQNEVMKKISGWAAVFFAPTLVAGIYGMNFRFMPELNWAFGYPFAILLMIALTLLLYWLFKRSKWM